MHLTANEAECDSGPMRRVFPGHTWQTDDMTGYAHFADGWRCLGMRWLAALSLLVPVAAGAQAIPDLGTLFYSADERVTISRAHLRARPGASRTDASAELTGLVKRGGQKSTAWINGQPVAEGQAVPIIGVPRIGAKSVIVDGQSLRVREALDLETGARSDVLPEGAVSVRQAK